MEHSMDKLTVGQILKGLSPGQFWAVVGAVFFLVAGAFGVGYKLQLSTSEIRAERSAAKLAEFRGLQTKERFLALYLRYLIAKGNLQAEENDENQRALIEARDAYFQYIQELLKRGEEARDEIDLRGVILGKGGGKDVTVKFGYDGSVWTLPRELGLATAN